MLTKEEIDRLIKNPKYIQEHIKWSPESRIKKSKYSFRVQVISIDGIGLYFEGNYSNSAKKVKSLVLLYNRIFPLVRIDRSFHRNPHEMGGHEFRGWHKHKFDPVWKDLIAHDVSHEFNDMMNADEFFDQFRAENNILLPKGITYQRLMESFI